MFEKEINRGYTTTTHRETIAGTDYEVHETRDPYGRVINRQVTDVSTCKLADKIGEWGEEIEAAWRRR